MTSEITNPSRRSVAKGAAWAVPAVAVAATAPSLAASACDVVLDVAVVCPPLLGLNTRNVYFTLTNNTACEIPADQPITLEQTGLVGLSTGMLNDLNVDVGVLFSDEGNAMTTAPIPAGESIEVEFIPDSLVTADLAGSATLTAPGGSATANFTAVEIDLSPLPSIQVALCV